MKTHTSAFKQGLKQFGRQVDVKISFTFNNEEVIIGNDELNEISPHYNGAILKSVMKQLDLDSNVYIPKETILHFEFGIKVRDNEVEDYRENYDYIDYGYYEVYSIEKQEDNGGYKIVCYDKMLKSMVDYEHMNITYPTTLRNYINTICTYLGITFKNASETFANYNRNINGELYLMYNEDTHEYESLGYTFRDVLDEIAQATGSTICINSNNQLEIRYINETGDTIDEEYLNEDNVNFGEQYGPVNTIILSRSGGADKIYISDPPDTPEANRIAIEISDNQIMNGNDRSDYLPDLINKLGGLQYYINDFSSKGILYYDLCDRFGITIGEQTYSCVMFNDEVNFVQGIEENIHTDMPEQADTDYTYVDKTDRRINETYLIVNKQDGEIKSLVSQTTDLTNPNSIASIQSSLIQRVDTLESEISSIADLTTSGETIMGSLTLTDIIESEPIDIKIHPTTESISYLYPFNGLFPSNTLYPKDRRLRFTNTTTNEVFDWELPTDLWRYNDEIFDELVFSYGDGEHSTIIVNRKCEIHADGSVTALATPVTETYPFEHIQLTSGDYTISLLGYPNGYLFVRLMVENYYTNQFYTKAQTDSKILQNKTEIEASVSATLEDDYEKKDVIEGKLALKLGKNENGALISMLNASADDITLAGGSRINLTTAGKLLINAGNFKLDAQGNMEATNGTFNGVVNATSGTFNGDIITTKTEGDATIKAQTLGANFLCSYDDGQIYLYSLIQPAQISGGILNGNSYFLADNQMDINTSDTNLHIGAVPNHSYQGDNYGYYIKDKRTNGEASLYHRYYDDVSFVEVKNSSGNGYNLNSTSGPTAISDKRDKDHIKNIPEKISIDIIKKIKPVTFTYKKSDRYHRGLIAQDVKKALDDNNIENQIYSYNVDNNHFQLFYEEFIADIINVEKYLLGQVQEQKNQIEQLKQEIKTLKESDK